MLRDPESPYVPVALLDDDRNRWNLRFMGVRVLGDRTAMAEVARSKGATAIIIADPLGLRAALVTAYTRAKTALDNS